MARWTAIPAARSSAPILKIRLYTVLAVMGVATLAGLFGAFAWLTADPPPPPPVIPPVAQATGEATLAARQYVRGEAITVPVATGIAPDKLDGGSPLFGSPSVSWQGFELIKDGGREVEHHRFLVAGEQNWQLTIPMEIGGPTPLLIAAPSLEPIAVAAEPPLRFDWLAFEQLPTSPQLTRTVEAWSAAFLTNNTEELQRLTGDLTSRVYAGLGGLTPVKTDIRGVVRRVDLEGFAVIRVEIGAESSSGWTGVLEYDLLARDVNTANPKIVAWGSGGSGGTLVEYQNALNG